MTVTIASIPAETASSQAQAAASAKTKAMRAVTAIGMINRRCDAEIDAARSNIAKFKTDLDKDAAYALQWADSTFQTAAALKVWSQLKAYVDGDKFNIWNAASFVRDNTRRAARYPSRSTSVSTNLIEDCIGVEWAEADELFSQVITFLAANGITEASITDEA